MGNSCNYCKNISQDHFEFNPDNHEHIENSFIEKKPWDTT